jgi:hypothetical protein
MSEDENTEAPVAEAPVEAPAKKKRDHVAERARRKAAKAAKPSKIARKVKKVLRRLAKKAAKANLPRGERESVPCCINFPRKLMRAMDAKAKKLESSRAACVNKLVAKWVGK